MEHVFHFVFTKNTYSLRIIWLIVMFPNPMYLDTIYMNMTNITITKLEVHGQTRDTIEEESEPNLKRGK